MQDVLGTFQDSEAQREAIYALATDMMARDGASARTILAMGEIAARLQEDQDSSRARFAAMFERFARRPARRRTADPGRHRAAPAEPAAAASARSGAMKVVATYNIKGGVGKTSTAVNLAYLAARDGLRTLLWDLDPQGSATYLFRVKPKVKGGGSGARRGQAHLGRRDQGNRLRPARSDAGRLQLPQPRLRPGLHEAPHGPDPPPDRAAEGASTTWSSSTARRACPWCRRTSSTPATCCSSR